MYDSLWPHELYSPWNSLGQNTGVGRLSLLQGIFPTQGVNPGLPHCRQILYQLSHKGSTVSIEWRTKTTGACMMLSGEKFSCQRRRHRFDPWSGKIPHASEQMSPRTTTTEPVLQSPGAATTEVHMPESLCSTRETTTTTSWGTTTRE